MQLRLAESWWMGALMALTGIVLLALNVRFFGPREEWLISVLSTAAAVFVTVLGFALTVRRREENV